jgi:pseudouridine-5'-phosphate glycosidase/pseudouridine kinase
MGTSGIATLSHDDDARTAQYVAVNDTNKDLVLAMADMGILERTPSTLLKDRWTAQIYQARPKFVVVDANWAPEMLSFWFSTAKAAGAQTVFEPVSTAKSTRLFHASPLSTSSLSSPFSTTKAAAAAAGEAATALTVFPHNLIDITTPNALELSSMHAAARAAGLFDRPDWWSTIDAMGIPATGARTRFERLTSPHLADLGVPQQSIQLLPFVPCILTKLGKDGVVLSMLLRKGDERLRSRAAEKYIVARASGGDASGVVGGVYLRLFRPEEVLGAGEVVSVNGVGDTFLGAVVARLAAATAAAAGDGGEGEGRVEDVIAFAQRAAVVSLRSAEAVGPELATFRD